MEKIIIHTYPARLWYVKNFLVPSLLNQGIDNIVIVNDKNKIGNLLSFVLSLKGAGSAWHLQDDVVICKDFAKRIKKYKNLACGFCAEGFEVGEIIEGITNITNMWFSFPCLHIPADISEEFYNWFMEAEKTEDFQTMINTGKMDDLIFKEYLIKYHPNIKVTNIAPNLVDHIDYLIGGSIANAQRQKIARAKSFEDLDLIKDLEGRLTEYKIQNQMI